MSTPLPTPAKGSPPAYDQINTEHTPLLPPPPPPIRLQPRRSRPVPAQAPGVLRFSGFCALVAVVVCALVLSLAVSYPAILTQKFFFLTHAAAFDLPLGHALLAIQAIHLSLVALSPSSTPCFPLAPASHALGLAQFAVVVQLAIILLTRQLRIQESGLTILSGLLLLCCLTLASDALSLATRTTSRSIILIRFPPHPSLSIWLSNIHPPSQPLVSRLKHYRAHFYVYFLTANTLLLTTSVLFKAQDAHLSSNQLHHVHVRLPNADHAVSTALQFTCSAIHSPYRPSATHTILHFSPSAQTAAQSSQWISSLSSPRNTALRLCVFDRPGYNHSYNLPISRISDSVSVLEAVLEQTGEFKRLAKDRGSGLILVGNGYGALEVKIFAARHSSLIKSILLINPETEKTFFKLDSEDQRDIDIALISAFQNFYAIVSSIWTFTLNRILVQLELYPLSTSSPSLTRALLQENFLARSLNSYEDFVSERKTYPIHLPYQILNTDREEDWRKSLSELVEL